MEITKEELDDCVIFLASKAYKILEPIKQSTWKTLHLLVTPQDTGDVIAGFGGIDPKVLLDLELMELVLASANAYNCFPVTDPQAPIDCLRLLKAASKNFAQTDDDPILHLFTQPNTSFYQAQSLTSIVNKGK